MESFKSNLLLGKLYGLTYELLPGGKLAVKEDLPITEVGKYSCIGCSHRSDFNTDATDATNENIASSAGAQGLTAADIALLKAEGVHGKASSTS
jgi:hypothetical protein